MIWFLILLILVISGWRNLILTYFIFTFTPIFTNKRPKISTILIFGMLFLTLFSLIGFLRGDQGSKSVFEFSSAFNLILLYIYPAFINFETLQSMNIEGSHYFTLQFLFKPIFQAFGMIVEPPQNAVGAFNVSTGLHPLYQDGGLVNIFFVFLVIGILLRILLKMRTKGIIIYFLISSIYATLFYLHNGWFLLNYMFSYNICAYLLLTMTFRFLVKSRKQVIITIEINI